MEGTIPTPQGEIHLRMDRQQLTLTATEGVGWLYLPGSEEPQRIECGQTYTFNLN